MKKSTFLVIVLFINNLLTAQIATFSDSIFWQSNKTFVDNDEKVSDILSFNGDYTRSTDNFPVYFAKTAISTDADIIEIVLVKADYQVVNKEVYQHVKNIEKISGQPETNAWVSTFRKEKILNFELVPLRKNPQTGEIEKLIYFEYKVKYSTKSSQKSSVKYISSSALSSGNWYKIKITESGMYKLTYSQLTEMGFTNMSGIGIFGYGGLLPKTAGEVIADDLPERSVYKVDANSNSVFDNGDYLLFYAEGPHDIVFDKAGSSHEFHNYSDCAYYFVSDQGSMKPAAEVASLSDYDYNVTTYDDYKFLEKDSLNLMKSGRTMYWREFDYYMTYNFTISCTNVSFSDTAKAEVNLAAKSSVLSYFDLYINGVAQNRINISSVSGSSTDWYARTNSLHSFKIKPTSDTFTFSLTYNKTATNSKGWLDNISIQLRRKLIMDSGFLAFRDLNSVEAGKKAKFSISNAESGIVVWDITDRFSANKINGSYASGSYSFIADASTLHEYVAFYPSASFPSPVYTGQSDVGPVANQNLHSLQPSDLIIVAHPDFYSQGEGIKALHEQYDEMSVVITTPQRIYNEFSSGAPDVSAIRNFVKMLYDRAGNEDELPMNLLLLGDGSYDNLSNDPAVSNFILTYESESSLAPVSSYVTDDFYVFLDDGEGSISGAHNMDMGVGRIPVKTADEADAFLGKLRTYYSPASYGNWKNNILLIADDAEGGETIHQTQSNNLALQIEGSHPVFNIDKIFLDDYEQVSTVQGHRYPDVNQAINDYINNGVLVVNWIGHGNEKGWAHESVLTLSMIKTWRNKDKYPIFVTATCEFSPFDHHTIVSGGEEVLLNADGGGIALFTTTRLAFASSNASLSYKFYSNIFEVGIDNKINTIGLSVAYAKNAQGSDTNKRVFEFLGDPAMRPAVPLHEAFTTKINGEAIETFNDTIRAMSHVSFEGVVKNPDGSLATDFNGLIYPVVYDKRMDYSTRGNDGYNPLNYTAQKNIIFKGKASVVNGVFNFNFIVPVDIAYFYDNGKVSYYAHNNSDTEAHGYDESFIIGGSSDNPVNDNEGPVIDLFMNDEQFVPGGITDENPLLLAKISDESGINTVGSGIGHDITMVVDANTAGAIVLNKFYESATDDFTTGEVNYPMSELELGPHTLTVKAWDVINNSSEAVTDFIVANSSELVIDHIFNYPNPFSTNTSFYFDHNQPFVNLDVLIQVFTVSGKHIKTIEADVLTTGYRSEPIVWDGKDEYGDKLAKGVYIYKVKVKSPTGAVVDKFEKLVILN